MAEFRTLEMYPAIGFISDARWQVAADQHEKAKPQAGKSGHRMWARPTVDTLNGTKVLGYIPVINVIIGIIRILFFSKDYKNQNTEDKANSKQHILRGVAEILVGPLLLIPDLIVTLRDRSVVKAYMSKHPEAAQIPLCYGNYRLDDY